MRLFVVTSVGCNSVDCVDDEFGSAFVNGKELVSDENCSVLVGERELGFFMMKNRLVLLVVI